MNQYDGRMIEGLTEAVARAERRARQQPPVPLYDDDAAGECEPVRWTYYPLDQMERDRREAMRDSEDWRDVDAIWYEYDLVNGEAVNERRRDDIGKGVLL